MESAATVFGHVLAYLLCGGSTLAAILGVYRAARESGSAARACDDCPACRHCAHHGGTAARPSSPSGGVDPHGGTRLVPWWSPAPDDEPADPPPYRPLSPPW